MSNNTGIDDNTHMIVQSADYVIGTVLALSVILGVTGNTVAIRYFSTRPSRSANTIYFNYLYQLIAIFDLMTCVLAIIPAMVAFSTKRSLALNLSNSGFFKELWTILWVATTLSNPFMIGLLSTSRLVLLAYPRFTFRVSLAYALPIANFIINCGIRMGLRFSGYVKVVCWNSVIGCEYYPSIEDITLPASWFKMIGWRLFDIIQLGCPIPLVALTCLASIVMLKKNTKEKSKNQKLADATTTVIIVTVIYLILNTSQFGFYCYLMDFLMNFKGVGEIQFIVFMGEFYKHFSTNFMLKYLFVLCYHVPVTLNSGINPLLYFWRMRPFRFYVRHRGTHKSTKASSMAMASETQRASTVSTPGVFSNRRTSKVEDGVVMPVKRISTADKFEASYNKTPEP